MEEDAEEAGNAASEWGAKATAASRKGQELPAAGSATEADEFDNLARIALKKQIDYENDAEVEARPATLRAGTR